jgi:glycosyltransferase involved in cell wall biosynthesis
LLLLLARKPPRHVMIGHLLTTRSKRAIFRLLKPQRRIDVTLVHATNQRRQAATVLSVSPDRLRLVPYQADTNFWRPQVCRDTEPIIATAGLEYRDYATLAEAVRDLSVRTIIAAGSHWSHHQHNLGGVAVPDNIHIVSLDYPALRDLYARAAFVVVPLRPVENQAGITTILEAMAMGKAVIVTATEGQRDVVRGRLCTAERFESVQGDPAVFGVDTATVCNETGIYVQPGDAAGLRRAIEYLLSAPEEAERLGAAGRALVLDSMNLERFVERVADALAAPAVERAAAYV